jgi:hypothetical protein
MILSRDDSRNAQPAQGFPVWIFALAGVLLLMAGANGYMVWLSSHERHDLVRADYYDAGLQEDKSIALNAASHAAGHVTLERTGEGWELRSSADVIDAPACRAYFYRPDDDREDRAVMLSRAAGPGRIGGPAGGLWRGSGPGLRRGKWDVKLVWERNGASVSEMTVEYQAP